VRRHPDRAGRVDCASPRSAKGNRRQRRSRPDHHGNRRTLTERVRLVRYTPAATLQWPYLKLHQFVYRHSGGLIGSRIVAGSQALLLTTTGRRSGEPRTCALIYLKDGERLVVVASNGGSDHPPSWLLNLQADPDVGVQIGRKNSRREPRWPQLRSANGCGRASTGTTWFSLRSCTPARGVNTTCTSGTPHA
jgi:deazaflavin-dependent oxidoreductase (nitroreductase family)